MPQILTLALNPALDVSTSTERVMDTHKVRCTVARQHPGGGGINVARVVHRLGGDCLAVFPAGGITGQLMQALLYEEQVRCHCVAIAGQTRESFSVYESASGRDYRFVLPGPHLAASEWTACLDFVKGLMASANVSERPQFLVISGSLPPGVPVDFCAQVALAARKTSTRVVVDTSGAALAAALAAGVYLVKPSLRELRDLTGQALTTEDQWHQAALQLISQGQTQVVALSLGEDGALLVTADQALRAKGVSVPVASSIGAGDSFVGGLIWALNRGDDLEQAFRYGMAAGAAALLKPGTALCQRDDVERLHSEVKLVRV